MSAEGPGRTNENYLTEIKRLVTEEYSLLRAALAKLEEKVGPVTADNIFEKSSGTLTHEEADDLYTTALADRDQGINSAQLIIERFEKEPPRYKDEEMGIRRQMVEEARSLFEKLNS